MNMSQRKCVVTGIYQRKIRESINYVTEEKTTRLSGGKIMNWESKLRTNHQVDTGGEIKTGRCNGLLRHQKWEVSSEPKTKGAV